MVLQSVSSNLPRTPGRQVKYLKSELEKKDAENEALNNKIADLSKALESIQLVKDSAKAAAPEEDKKRGKKDKNAPKPAITAYKYFCEEVKAAPGGDDPSAKEMQQMWKDCQGDAREKYLDMAAEDKKRFEAESAEYEALQKLYQQREQNAAMELYEAHKVAAKALAEGADKDAKKKKKSKKDPDAPKKALSSYMFFCGEKREEITKKHAGKSPTEITKILGEEWNKLEKGKGGKKGTKKYDTMAAKDRARYEKEKAAFDALKAEQQQKADEAREVQLQNDREEARKMVEEEQKESAAKLEAEMAKAGANEAKSTKADKPKGPKKPSSAYNFFVSENHEKIKASMGEATFAEISSEVGRQWGLLNEKQKKPFVDMANKDKERYQKELQASSA